MSVVAAVARELKHLGRDGKGLYLVTIAGGWGTLLGVRMIYPVILPYLRSEFDLSLTVAGFLLTILWLGSAVGQLPGGILADRYGERKILALGSFLVAGSVLLVVGAPTPILLFVATGLVGLGQSLYPIARITILSKIYPDRIGSALGLTMATGDLGQTVFPPVAGVIAVALTWKFGLLFIVPFLLLAGVALWLVLPSDDRPQGSGRSLSLERRDQLIAELRQSNMIFFAFILFMFIFVWQSFTGLYPTYLVEVKGLPSSTASVLFSLFFAFGVVVKPLSGAAYDRVGVRGTLIALLAGPILGFLALPFITGFWPLVGATALVSTMLGSGAVTQSFLSESLTEEIRGTGLGVVRTIVATLGAVGPLAFGALADRGYFDEGYLLLALVFLGVVLLTLRLPESA